MNEAFLHNWADRVTVETAWRTAVSASESTQAEERVGLGDRPTRAITFRWTGITRDEGNRILIALAKASGSGLSLPLYCDQAITTASSSGTTINAPTANRRLAAGAQVVLADLSTGRPTNVRYPTIDSLAADAITTSATITDTYPAGSVVWPLVTVQPVLEPAVRFMTDGTMEVTLTTLEVPESALAALDDPGDTPAGFSTYDLTGDLPALPIFDVEPDWSGGVVIGLVRAADAYAQGRSQVVEVRGTRPRFTLEASLLLAERADVFSVLTFFDSRGGRLAPFWLAAPVALWEPTNLDTGFVDVETDADATEADDCFTYVALVMEDGTVYVRPISTITAISGGWRVAVSDSFPSLALADVKRVTPAFLVRFAEDAIREEWVTDEVCRIPLRAVELLAEAEAAIA